MGFRTKRALTFVLAAMIAVIQGCITAPVDYAGPKPDFSLKGEAARTEYERFHLNESYWGIPFEMGPGKTRYTYESIKPIVAEVSPKADRKFGQLITLGRANQILLMTSIGFFVAGLVTGDSQMKRAFFTAQWVTVLPAIFVLPYVGSAMNQTGSELYNRDLGERLNLGLQGRVDF